MLKKLRAQFNKNKINNDLLNSIVYLNPEYKLKQEIKNLSKSQLRQICKDNNLRLNIDEYEMIELIYKLKKNIKISDHYKLPEKIIPNKTPIKKKFVSKIIADWINNNIFKNIFD